MNFKPTHITERGTLVTVDSQVNPSGEVLVRFRDGSQGIRRALGILELDSPAGEEFLAELGLRTETAGQEDDSNRVVLARWAQCLDASRSTLADAIREVLAYGETGHRAVTRLQKAQADALEDLAFFKP